MSWRAFDRGNERQCFCFACSWRFLWRKNSVDVEIPDEKLQMSLPALVSSAVEALSGLELVCKNRCGIPCDKVPRIAKA
jgi:hypothetical protein